MATPMAKAWVIILYLLIGVCFYSFGGMVCKDCDDDHLIADCGAYDEALLFVNATYAECVSSCTQSWTIIDGLYFSMVTMSTVGYGDLTPGDRWEARLFTCFFIIVGIAGPFLIISIELGRVLNKVEKLFHRVMCRSKAIAVDIDGDGDVDYVEPASAFIYYARGYLFWIVILMCINLTSAAIYTLTDPSMGYANALYHCWVTATTVGYGDIGMQTQAARAWSCVNIAVSVGALGALIGKAQELFDSRRKQLQRVMLLKKKLDRNLICSLDKDGSGVDKLEFVIGMLVKLELVQWNDVEPFIAQFDMLDVDGSGRLTEEDLAAMVTKLAERCDFKAEKVPYVPPAHAPIYIYIYI